jgi:diacylglycerol kinase family enzyme
MHCNQTPTSVSVYRPTAAAAAAAAVKHRYDTLVAGGGDGTLNELVVALLRHKAPRHIAVAQLPLGTANDLASATGISLVSAAEFGIWLRTSGLAGLLWHSWHSALPTTWPLRQASYW